MEGKEEKRAKDGIVNKEGTTCKMPPLDRQQRRALMEGYILHVTDSV